MVGHHEGGVEAHAELADDVGGAVLLHALLELEGAAACDGAQVLLQLLLRHALFINHLQCFSSLRPASSNCSGEVPR